MRTSKKRFLNIIKEITGLNEQQINHLPDDYFPAVNGNVIHFGSNGTQSENGAFTFEMGNEEQPTENTDYTKQFVAQVSYEEFQELMKKQKVSLEQVLIILWKIYCNIMVWQK